MNILYREYLEIEGLKRGYEEPKIKVFSMGLMQVHPHYCVGGGVIALAEDPQIQQVLQRPSNVFRVSRLDAPKDFLLSQILFSLPITYYCVQSG